MKLTPQQTERIQQKTGFAPVPPEVAAQSGLTQHFGDNTFYLNADGVYVFEESGQAAAESAEDTATVTAVKVAAVEPTGQGNEVVVRGVEPQETDLTVELA